jgi:hypothetical protein
MKTLSLVILSLGLSHSALAAKKTNPEPSNLGVAPVEAPAPNFNDLGFFNDKQIEKLSESFKAEMKRRPSGSSLIGSEDLMSKELKEFRDKMIKARDGYTFAATLTEYDKNYDNLPNDLKFVVARMSTFLPFRGIVWRATPLIHQTVVTQEMLLTTIRNMAEQVMINNPDSHLQAQMAFLSMPHADILGKQFKTEQELTNFFAIEVYPALGKAIKRLENIKMVNVDASGRETPIVFDAKIRFGEHAFSDAYDATDRFKIVGEAERFATLARYHRRLSNIAQTAAYNWNGHLALRRDIGRKFGVDAVKSNAGFLGFGGGVFIDGVTRKERVEVIRQPKFANLYTLLPNGKQWTKLAFNHLHASVMYLDKAWTFIRDNRDPSEYMQLDPEVFQARKDQIDEGVANMKRLVSSDGPTTIQGALSGDKLTVNVKAFFENPPRDMKTLYPTEFAADEDVMPLKAKFSDMVAKDGTVKMKLGNQPVEWRNYFYGRAKAWNREAYKGLFPDVKSGADVARAQRILNETRGSRLISLSTTLYIR